MVSIILNVAEGGAKAGTPTLTAKAGAFNGLSNKVISNQLTMTIDMPVACPTDIQVHAQ